MQSNFYDKIAKKFGGYGYGTSPHYVGEYPAGDPEKVFKEKLLGWSSIKNIALDVGCADGKFTLSVAPFFQKVYGIDVSKVNLEIAESHSDEDRSKNVQYSLQDASHTLFENSFFDLIYCRRGPKFYKEYNRILKKGGYYIEIGVGERDTVELKKIFGRGQNFGKWGKSILEEKSKELKDLGFQIIFAKDYHYFEYYPSYEEFNLFLQGVPIFEDFDSEKDRKMLTKYVNKFQMNRGIVLSRHRVVLEIQKSLS